jgi:hypothetical protein
MTIFSGKKTLISDGNTASPNKLGNCNLFYIWEIKIKGINLCVPEIF